MAKIVLVKVVKELKLVKVVATSRFWRSWWPLKEAFQQSQTLLRRSTGLTVDWPLF